MLLTHLNSEWQEIYVQCGLDRGDNKLNTGKIEVKKIKLLSHWLSICPPLGPSALCAFLH